MKAKMVYEFVRGRDPKESLGLGRVGTIRKWFRDLDISDNMYEITEEQIIINGLLNLSGTSITELPEGLRVGGNLYLIDTPITELPERLSVGKNIYIDNSQIELKTYIMSSKFADKLEIWK